MSGLPLEGLKVLDLSRLLPGPYATLVMADLGAQVDKLEDPAGGDYIRQMPPMRGELSALFLALNRNKRSITLDLKAAHGPATLRRLVRHYDVLVESFRPGVMQRLGCGYETLAAENPKLIYCAISGYGQTGPDRLKAGHDLDYIARAGVLAYGGEAGGAPAVPGAQMGDIGGGSLFGLVGVLSALYERQRTGLGRLVDISMTEGALAFIHMHLGARLALGDEGTPLQRGRETLNGGFACYGTYRTKDSKYLAVGALEPKFFEGLCAVLKRPELMAGGYDSGELGRQTRHALEEIFAGKTRDEWVAVFDQHDLCVEPVLEGDEVLSDRQLTARGMFVQAEGFTQIRTPVHLGQMPTRAAPSLGEHTATVLSEAGFTPAEVQAIVGA